MTETKGNKMQKDTLWTNKEGKIAIARKERCAVHGSITNGTNDNLINIKMMNKTKKNCIKKVKGRAENGSKVKRVS